MRAILLADKVTGLLSYPGEGNPGSRIFFSAAEFSGDLRYRTQVKAFLVFIA